jgi:hypothetical protein
VNTRRQILTATPYLRAATRDMNLAIERNAISCPLRSRRVTRSCVPGLSSPATPFFSNGGHTCVALGYRLTARTQTTPTRARPGPGRLGSARPKPIRVERGED